VSHSHERHSLIVPHVTLPCSVTPVSHSHDAASSYVARLILHMTHDSCICVTWGTMRQCRSCECNDAVSHIWVSDNAAVSLQCHSHMSDTASFSYTSRCLPLIHMTHTPNSISKSTFKQKKSLIHRSDADSCTWVTLGSQLSLKFYSTQFYITNQKIRSELWTRTHTLKHEFTLGRTHSNINSPQKSATAHKWRQCSVGWLRLVFSLKM